MNELQTEFLKRKTCYILDQNNDLESELRSHGIPEKYINKINNAFDLIFEVNQACIEKEKNKNKSGYTPANCLISCKNFSDCKFD